ncbi:PQQ-binding-like beta-propeller repeat protein [Streptomyces sp. NPDC050418]|uniref:outer membrane protein assembly factor BamB family protein n=1 Tax=Streptomyces sp. NPDC050418 TaxID=3365612 RepID=UPI0037AB8661
MSRLGWIVGVVVAFVLVVGGGVWFVWGGDDEAPGGGDRKQQAQFDGPGTEKKPVDPKARLLFPVMDPKVGKNETAFAPGAWVTDETYVKNGLGSVAGYDLKSGRQVWEIALGGEICDYTQTVDEGRTGVLFRDGMPGKGGTPEPCTEIAVLDLDAGLMLWQHSVKRSGTKIAFRQLAVGAGKVAVAGDGGGAAFELGSGDLRWEPRPAQTCYDMAYEGSEDGLVALQNCGHEENSRAQVQVLDDGGKPRSTYKLPKALDFAQLVSADPLVVAGFSEAKLTDYFSIDRRKGTLRSKIAVDPERFGSPCTILVHIHCDGVAVGNDRLYLATEERRTKNDAESVNEIVSFDLATGKATGQRADSGGKNPLRIIRMDGRDLIASRMPTFITPGQVIKIDGRTFKETVYLTVPEKDRESAAAQQHFAGTDKVEIRYTDGRLFLSELSVRQPDPDDPPYLAAVFGASD